MVKNTNQKLVAQGKKTIILGVGNPILCDDGVGIHVARRLKHVLRNTQITIEEAYTGGLPLVDMLRGYDKALLIDAFKSPSDTDGSVKRITFHDLPTAHSCNPHDMDFLTAVHLAKKMGDALPQEIIIIGIVVNTPPCFGDHLTPRIARAVPKAVTIVLKELAWTLQP